MQGLCRSNAGSHTGPLSAACTGPVSFWPQGLQWARAGCLYGLRSGSYGLTVYVYGLRSEPVQSNRMRVTQWLAQANRIRVMQWLAQANRIRVYVLAGAV